MAEQVPAVVNRIIPRRATPTMVEAGATVLHRYFVDPVICRELAAQVFEAMADAAGRVAVSTAVGGRGGVAVDLPITWKEQ